MQPRRIVKVLNVLTTARLFRVTLILAIILALVPGWSGGNVNAGCPSGFFFSAGQCWPCTGGPFDGPECAGGTEPEPEPPSDPWWKGGDDNGQYRVNPNPAEDYAVYCRPPGWVEVWRTWPAPPRKIAGFPINFLFFGDGSTISLNPWAEGRVDANATREGDRVIIHDKSLPSLPQARNKGFSLAECVKKAGLPPDQGNLGNVPCDPAALAAAEARAAELEAQLAQAQAELNNAQAKADAAQQQAEAARAEADAARREAAAAQEAYNAYALAAEGAQESVAAAQRQADATAEKLRVAEAKYDAMLESFAEFVIDILTLGPLKDALIEARSEHIKSLDVLIAANDNLIEARADLKRVRDRLAAAEAEAEAAKQRADAAQAEADRIKTFELGNARAKVDSVQMKLTNAQAALAALRAACEGQNE